MNEFWKKVHGCIHTCSDYWDSGRCGGAEGCEWTEMRCNKCRVYLVECCCGCSNTVSGWPKRRNDRN